MYALVFLRAGMWEASDKERAGKHRTQKKAQKDADGICIMAAPSLCLSRHAFLNYFTLSKFTKHAYSSFSHCYQHTRKIGLGCILEIKTGMSFRKPWCVTSWVQNPRCSESRVSVWRFSLRYVASFLPKAAGLDQREREYDAGEGREDVVGGAYFSRSVDLTFGHC